MAPEDDLESEVSLTCLPPYCELECGSILGSVELFECVPREALHKGFDEGGFARGRYCYLFCNSQDWGSRSPPRVRRASGNSSNPPNPRSNRTPAHRVEKDSPGKDSSSVFGLRRAG
jgi:hypothetical protein